MFGWFRREPEKPNYFKIVAITLGIIAGIGAAAVVSSIPVICVGHAKRKKVINSLNKDSYIANNNSETTQPAVNLSVQASQNGIGLALNF